MEILIAAVLIIAIITLARVNSVCRRIDEIRFEQSSARSLLRKIAGSLPENLPQQKPFSVEEPKPGPEAARPQAGKSAAPQSPAPPPPLPSIPSAAPAEPVSKAEPPPAREPSAIAQILRRIWEWILVGDEYRKPGVSAEQAIASTWLLRAGIVLIVACVGYFLKWSMDQGLLGPLGRTSVSILAGASMLAAGYRLFGRRYHLLGQGLFGGGLATLYFSMYAAGPLYGLVPIWVSFVMMILVTVTAGLLSVRVNSMLIAILGIIGGFCTPIMLSTGKPDFVVLYLYLLMLGGGILALAHYKSWRLLNYLGFVLTWAMVVGSLFQYEKTDFAPVMTLTAMLFVLHSSIVYWHNLVRREKTTALEIVYLAANAAVFSLTAYMLIRVTHGRPWPSVMTFLLSMFFTLHVFALLRIRKGDRNLLVALIALAGLFAVLTMPLVLEKESLTMSWALLAFAFLWLSGRVGSPFLRKLSYLLYFVVFLKLTAFDLATGFGCRTRAISFGDYLTGMSGRLWTFGMSIASIFAAFFVERRRMSTAPAAAAEPLEGSRSSSRIRTLFYWCGILFLFVYAQFEVAALFRFFSVWRQPALTALWVTMGAYFLFSYVKTSRGVALWAAGVFLVAGALKVSGYDWISWRLNDCGVYMSSYDLLNVSARLFDVGLVLGALFAAWRLLVKRSEPLPLLSAYGYGGLFLLFVYTSLEVNTLLFWRLRGFQAGGMSALWAVYAMAFVAVGIWKQLAALRYAGLALFAAVVAKAFLVDLVHTPVIYRVVAFLVVGIALLAGAFAYLKAAPRTVDEGGRK